MICSVFPDIRLLERRPERRSGVARATTLLNILVAVGLAWLILKLVGPSFRSELPVGYPLTVLSLEPLTPGTPPVQLADLKGKVTVINYWATWCGPCVEEFPHLMSLAKSYSGRSDFQLLSVATGQPDDATLLAETTQFLQPRNASGLAVYSDQGDATRAALQQVPLGYVPLTVVVDREGKVAKVSIGYTAASFEEMKLLIASLLQAKGS